MNTNDPKNWKPCNRPLSQAEWNFAKSIGERRAVRPIETKLPVVQKRIPAQNWFSTLRVDEEVGARESELSVSLFAEQT